MTASTSSKVEYNSEIKFEYQSANLTFNFSNDALKILTIREIEARVIEEFTKQLPGIAYELRKRGLEY